MRLSQLSKSVRPLYDQGVRPTSILGRRQLSVMASLTGCYTVAIYIAGVGEHDSS